MCRSEISAVWQIYVYTSTYYQLSNITIFICSIAAIFNLKFYQNSTINLRITITEKKNPQPENFILIHLTYIWIKNSFESITFYSFFSPQNYRFEIIIIITKRLFNKIQRTDSRKRNFRWIAGFTAKGHWLSLTIPVTLQVTEFGASSIATAFMCTSYLF